MHNHPLIYIIRFVVAVAVLAVARPVAGQRAAGPYAGLLGSSGGADSSHSLDVRGSLFGSWDDILTRSEESAGDERFLRTGLAGGASGGLTYARRTRRLDWRSSANTSALFYGTSSDEMAATFGASSVADVTVNRRVLVSLNGAFLYSPYYGFAPVADDRFTPGGPLAGGFGIATAAERNIQANAAARINVSLSRRDTVYGEVGARRYNFLDQSESSITSYNGLAGFRHALTGSLGVHAAFSRDQGLYEFGDQPSATNDTIDVGVDFGDTLTFARRTALSFSSSTSVLRWQDESHFRFNASALLTRGFGRTGSGSLSYLRDSSFVPGFREPLMSDTISGGYSDQIGRRTSWSTSVGYMRGDIGFDADDRKYRSYNAGGRLTTGLTRYFGVFGDYTYYRYDVPESSTVFDFIPQFSRQTFSVGLTLWAPLIDERRPAPQAAR